nr:GNAT family N-acetyltransferase [Orenia metallireducens]
MVRGCFQSCYLGYHLDKEEVNNGYMTEALEEAINFLFEEFKLHRIEANIMPKNNPSLRVVQKLGFYNEGLAKKYLTINGKWEDHIHMVLLNEEVE